MAGFAIKNGGDIRRGQSSRASVAGSLVFALGMANALADSPPVRVVAGKVQYGDWTLEGVKAELAGNDIALRAASLVGSTLPDLRLRNLVLACKGAVPDVDTLCSGGDWSFTVAPAEGGQELTVEGITQGLEPLEGDREGGSEAGWQLNSSVISGPFTAQFSSQVGAEATKASLRWGDQPLFGWPAIEWFPAPLQWVSKGTSSGQLTLEVTAQAAPIARYEMTVKSLGFDSPEGRFAGENLEFKAAGAATAGDVMQASFTGAILAGDLLIDNFYASFADRSLQFETRLSTEGDQLRLTGIRIGDGRALELAASASLKFDQSGVNLDYRIDHLELHFPEAYERYIESMASAWTLGGLAVTGSVLWSGVRDGAGDAAGILDVQDLSIVDTARGRFAVTGLDAHIVPDERADADRAAAAAGAVVPGLDSRFSWRGLLLRRINLGPGAASVNAKPGQFSLAGPLSLDVLGGRLAIEDLVVKLPGSDAAENAEPEIRLYASLENLDMEQLTQALDWPTFGGTVSGKIPGVRLQDGVLAVDGQMEFRVFDGQVLLSGLRIERPFGVLPSMASNLEVRELDLQQLTNTFSFGQISGRMSGFVHELRMLDWKPVAFDAWFGTIETATGAHGISRQAVNHLTTIGGGGATAALSGPVLKLFNDFSYKRLGLGCTLSNNVCEVRGLDDDESSVLIMEGAGIPKIMIRAYNRHMDWPTLVSGLTAASRGESLQIGDKK